MLAYAVAALTLAVFASILREWETALACASTGLTIGLLLWFLPRLALRRTFPNN